MLRPGELAWAYGGGFWFALVIYFAGDAKERGVTTPDMSATLVTVLGFGGFLLLTSIQAWHDLRREERTASVRHHDGFQAEE